MNNIVKKGFSLLLALTLVMGLSLTAFAAGSSVTFKNGKLIVFEPGSVYTDVDLFDGFNNVMPGDILSEEVTIQNKSDEFDYIKVYMRAIPHDMDGNPISENVLEEIKADDRRGDVSEIAYMCDFLSQLTMTVKSSNAIIFDGSPDELGNLAENVYLCTLRKGESTKLDVELNVPIEMGNEYANRIGEFDWVFAVEGLNDPIIPPSHRINLKVTKKWDVNGKNHPNSVEVTLYNGDKAVETVLLGDWNNWSYSWNNLHGKGNWQIVETNIPKGYVPTYSYQNDVLIITNTEGLIHTGQLNWPILVMGALGLVLIAYGIIVIFRKRKN